MDEKPQDRIEKIIAFWCIGQHKAFAVPKNERPGPIIVMDDSNFTNEVEYVDTLLVDFVCETCGVVNTMVMPQG